MLAPSVANYELIRPVVLFGRPAPERARETGAPARTIYRQAERFDEHGMASLFTAPSTAQRADDRRLPPPPVRQLIVDLRAEHPGFHPNEIATICYVQYGRRPRPHTVQRVLAEGPPPSRTGRRYPPYHAITDPAEARLAIIRLHSEGWSIKSIADYLQTSRPTVYATLRRWIAEGVGGLASGLAEVLGWVSGTYRDPAELHRIFYKTRMGRRLDQHGYVRFRHWRIYMEPCMDPALLFGICP